MSIKGSARAQPRNDAPLIVSQKNFGDDFTEEKAKRIAAIRDDLHVHSSCFRLAHIIASYISSSTGIAWPKQETLAERMGFKSKEGIKKLLDPLVARGHLLIVEKSKGRGRATVYAFPAVIEDKRANSSSPINEEKDEQELVLSAERANCSSEKGEQELAPTSFKELQKEERGEGSALGGLTAPNRQGEPFNRFWAVYPKRAGYDLARCHFDKAIENGADPEAIIEGAGRYAAAREGQDEQFTKFASNWLRERCWLKEPTKRPQAQSRRSSTPHVHVNDVIRQLGYSLEAIDEN
ncbi:hypothetical protein W911_06935 [Hyphomicrobium nitrativorans NL23]|uniref:Helix-turn-helix domain-containing protein n=1 Tax=Hyphomicrobium nitrativorans NL23 TaxID=1029756 RepID=V5SJD9_9HYPH|nr:helix-turn-helix domain-containing protein [Hyphomicrobium nitrativorans]AHB50074.1 hypothetical protein W911_06935 [Hyphomicrobium nitrativorans NL23]